MIFVLGNRDLLLKSKFYNPEYNWDYPLEELDYVINENTVNEMIYVVADDKRIYETSCTNEHLQKLYKDLKQDMKLRDFEMAALSLCIKYYVKDGINTANIKLKEWQETVSGSHPNIEEVTRNFKTIIEPLETYKKKRKMFNVKITEEAVKTVIINANSPEEAMNKVIQQYNDREIVFEHNDYKDVNIKACETIDIDIPEVNLSGSLYVSFDGVKDFESLKKADIKDLENEGELITIQMDKIEENPLNVALIAEENKLYLISYLYDNKDYKTDNLTSDPINTEKLKSEESLKDYMMDYFINVYVENIDLINDFNNHEEEEEI